jgi:hypothetical protein
LFPIRHLVDLYVGYFFRCLHIYIYIYIYNYVKVALQVIYITTKRIKDKRRLFVVTNNNSRICFDVKVTLYVIYVLLLYNYIYVCNKSHILYLYIQMYISLMIIINNYHIPVISLLLECTVLQGQGYGV